MFFQPKGSAVSSPCFSFRDGEIVHKGDLLFTIDARPYQIKLAEATAKLETATARFAFADRELDRAQMLRRSGAGTAENVDQRMSDQRAAQASVDDAKAQIRDAQFDIEHCRITAPFTGRIGKHLVSVGNLIAGSRAATSPTTLLATLVSLDPIHLDFDMSESDYLSFSQDREKFKGIQKSSLRRSKSRRHIPVHRRKQSLCAVFVPSAFLSGISGLFFRQFAVTIAASTVISCFVSLTLSPALCAALFKPHDAHIVSRAERKSKSFASPFFRRRNASLSGCSAELSMLGWGLR